ncbi:MAG: HAD family hydrolase [Myxococcaceae bacterium]|nr:HAD family hydrolase [Myxococcaceae bacterium]
MPTTPIGRAGAKYPTSGAVVDRPKTPVADAPVRTQPADRYTPIGLPVTTLNAELSLKGTQVQVGPHAPPRPVLAMEEIRLAPADHRRTLVRRFAASLAFVAGNTLQKTSVSSPAEGSTKLGPWSLTSKNGELTVSHAGGQSVTLSASSVLKGDPRDRARELLVDAFSHLLAKRGDPQAEKLAASSYLFAHGVLASQGRPKAQREGMVTPKLIAWDFNGTVQADNGRFRPGMAQTVESLRRLGAMNVLTTSISAEPSERAMDEANIYFDAHFGNAEVRPTKGSKQYEGVAGLFGLDVEASHDNMVTIGDSVTDISGDRAAGLFIHDRDMVAGPAIEQLLLELDRRGDGSLRKGLAALLDGRSLDKPQTLRLGALQFDVSLRPGNPGKPGRDLPVIDRLHITLGPSEVAAILGAPISPAIEDSAQYRLAYEHLATTLDEQLVPQAIRAVKGDTTAVREAVERRLTERGEDVAVARKHAGGLKAWLAEPVSFDEVQGNLLELAQVGDPEVARAVRAAVRSFAADSEQAGAATMAAIGAQAKALQGALSSAANVIDPSAKLTRADIKIINRVLEQPETMFTRFGEVMTALSHLPSDDAQVEQIKQQLSKALPDVANEYRAYVKATFVERMARADELAPIDALAAEAAKVRPAAFQQISAALGAL